MKLCTPVLLFCHTVRQLSKIKTWSQAIEVYTVSIFKKKFHLESCAAFYYYSLPLSTFSQPCQQNLKKVRPIWMSPPKADTRLRPFDAGTIFLALLALRIANALTLRTFFQPDEYYQVLEPAWQIAFGQESGAWITWVYAFAISTYCCFHTY